MEDRIRVLDGFHSPKEAVKLLVKHAKLKKRVWECANGYNRISNRLEKRGHKVFRSDIHKWSDKTQKIADFTKTKFVPFKGKPFDIVTNPPFKIAQEFVESAMDKLPVGGRLYLLLRLQFLEGKRRKKELFSKYPPMEVIVSSARLPRMHRFDFSLKQHRREVEKAGKKYSTPTSAMCFCWFVWEKKADAKAQAAIKTVITFA
jgi:hypothetical protein